MMTKLDSEMRSQRDRERNADKARLSSTAREIYIRGIARLGKAEEVARSGNSGSGYVIRGLRVESADD